MFYPNPVTNELVLINADFNANTYSVVNTMGQVMIREAKVNDVINVSELPNGVYFLMIKNKKSELISKAKFVKL